MGGEQVVIKKKGGRAWMRVKKKKKKLVKSLISGWASELTSERTPIA